MESKLYKGVHYSENKKRWIATYNGYSVGSYYSETMAAMARDLEAIKSGDFKELNFKLSNYSRNGIEKFREILIEEEKCQSLIT